MGFFDDNDSFFDEFFDFNDDGNIDILEEAVGLKIIEDIEKKCSGDYEDDIDFDDDDYDDDDSDDKYEWRLYCVDGFEYGIDPEDYDTEEEYEEALIEAKYRWRKQCESVLDTGVNPEDYDTEEEYQDALEERADCGDKPNGFETERVMRDCNVNTDNIIALKCLTHSGNFLYAQAIKDNFTLPCSLPNEYESREMEFCQILAKIARWDIPLTFEIWSWCIEQFLPYAQYDYFCKRDLCTTIISEFYKFSDDYPTKLIHYMDENPTFMQVIISARDKPEGGFSTLIAKAIAENLYNTANTIFQSELNKANGYWKSINTFTNRVIVSCKNYSELESIEYFRDNLLPLVKAIPDGMVQDEISEWEKEIAEYIDYVEKDCKQYAYTRKHAWRKTVPDGSEYGLNPLYYDTEQEYLDALHDRKYGWREFYKDRENYGLNVEEFETREEYQKALSAKSREKRTQERKQQLEQYHQKQQAKMQEYANDKTIYTYCGVILPFSSRPYYFRTDDNTIKIGDTVFVPVGNDEEEIKGTVVSVGRYSRLGVPYPVEHTKMIIQKIEDSDETSDE